MIDLSKGLFVENQRFLIPWGITNEEAWRTGSPTAWNLPDDKLRMKWNGAVILDGLGCVIQTYFPTSHSRLASFNIMDAHYNKHPPNVWEGILKAHCLRLFGEGKNQRSWTHDHVTLNLCHDDRFAEAYWLTITERKEITVTR